MIFRNHITGIDKTFMTRTYVQGLIARLLLQLAGEKKPEYAGRLLSRDLHLTDFEITGESA